MRVSKFLGILSIVVFLLAIVSLLLPLASAFPLAGHGVSFSAGQATYSGNSTTVPIQISNHGFLPIYGILLNASAVSANGEILWSDTFGPLNLAAGQTAPFGFSGLGATSVLQSNVTISGQARFNLAGMVPVSISFNISLSQTNSSLIGGPL